MQLDPAFVGVFVALGVGLLIGIDRELRKGAGRARRAAGVRTFVLVALAGAAARLLGISRPTLYDLLKAYDLQA